MLSIPVLKESCQSLILGDEMADATATYQAGGSERHWLATQGDQLSQKDETPSGNRGARAQSPRKA